MYDKARVETTFSRTAANFQKMGAYYTDIEHCKSIYNMFTFSKDEETCVLEPSIGDGSACIAATGAQENEKIKIFGVELNDGVAENTRKNPYVEEVVKADFITGTLISNSIFSFCFSNPPYMDYNEGFEKTRTEKVFLDKLIPRMKAGGIVVWIVPYQRFMEDDHFSLWMRSFETLHFFKFRKEEFEKWKQIVVIGKKRSRNIVLLKEDRIKEQQVYDFETVKELPYEFSEKIEVPTSSMNDIKTFTSRVFDMDGAFLSLKQEGLGEIGNITNKYLSTPKNVLDQIKRPPISMKRSNLYLAKAVGHGAGFAGTPGVDLHLQRGKVSIQEVSEYEEDEDNDSVIERVTTSAICTQVIIENSGTITTL